MSRDGWLCPKCGRGVSPDEKTCDHGQASTSVDAIGMPLPSGHDGFPADYSSPGYPGPLDPRRTAPPLPPIRWPTTTISDQIGDDLTRPFTT